ncbi:MAG: class I SAM-dependent methyltransferase [Chitinophagales bacterium]|nr:class I SAM-dependent methyltransferase [Chitinophagales bacterium]MCZ2392566.1 class I SAM-dependent methyltransferase [Chitinophagales bacterium]
MDIQLGGVQKTLLLPFVARIIETKHKNGILHDTKTLEIAKKIHFDLGKIQREMSEVGIAALAVRSVKFDKHIKAFQKTHPNGKILTLGAGLDTYFYRCDNGSNLWYDLDLDDTLSLREKLLPIPNQRVNYIKKSLFDITWIDDIGSIEEGLLILVPGVLPYFPEEDVKNFFKIISSELKGAAIVFDTISQMGILFVNQRIHRSGMETANLNWGIVDPKEMESWGRHIQVEEVEKYFKNISQLPRYNIITKQLMRLNDLFSISQIIKIRFI